MIQPDWRAPPSVRALVTTRAFGNMYDPETRRKLSALLPAEPAWLKQVHGKSVAEIPIAKIPISQVIEADASIARKANSVCAVMIADCMPVLFADEAGTTVAAAHAGWRGLAAGVLEATIDAMGIPSQKLLAWLGPAIGPQVYEVGDEVRTAFRGYETAFKATRPGHWLLDLYAVARQKLQSQGLGQISGGGFCTYSEHERFFSYRRDHTKARMAAFIWLT